MNIYKPQEFVEMIGVSIKTLQRWDNDKKLIAFRNPSYKRYYTYSQYIEYIVKLPEIKIVGKSSYIQGYQVVVKRMI